MKIRKGDMVKVTTGREKGKTGRVMRLDPRKSLVWVEHLNMVKRHQKPTQSHKQGGIVEKEAPLAVSNVMYYDEKAGRASRVGYKTVKGEKFRISKRSGEVIAAAKA
ncbi:MAG: 50S ribosomal protein L24 [Proteobacteria bacterium]|nr:50S ribosomal protein L24 [Pseudomonadota bacterium]